MSKRSYVTKEDGTKIERKTFTSDNGITIEILGVNQQTVDSSRHSVQYPDVPKYKVTTVTGDVELHDHNETTLNTDEDKAAWAKYQEDYRKAEKAEYQKVMDVLILKGTKFEMPTGEELQEWIELHEYLGLTVPKDNKYAMRRFYLEHEIACTPNDISRLMTDIMEASGVDREVTDKIKNSFRSGVEEVEHPTEGIAQ